VLHLPEGLHPARREMTVALCHGCFDVIHFGHVNHLETAATLADCLVVSITEDRYVGKVGRPVFATAERARVLGALSFVSHVIAVPAPDAIPVIEALRPEFFVKGSDYLTAPRDALLAARFRAERDLVHSYGGRVVHTRDDSFSTTEVLERLVGDSRQAR
jgi:rfaE bifunctional protein nucleotidyltransferase chain/domain